MVTFPPEFGRTFKPSACIMWMYCICECVHIFSQFQGLDKIFILYSFQANLTPSMFAYMWKNVHTMHFDLYCIFLSAQGCDVPQLIAMFYYDDRSLWKAGYNLSCNYDALLSSTNGALCHVIESPSDKSIVYTSVKCQVIVNSLSRTGIKYRIVFCLYFAAWSYWSSFVTYFMPL